MSPSNAGPWGMLLHEYSKGSFNIDRLAVSATLLSESLPYINELSAHPSVSQYLYIPTITTEKVDACLNVTAEHFGLNSKRIITNKNSLVFNLTAFTIVSNLPTFAEKVANGDLSALATIPVSIAKNRLPQFAVDIAVGIASSEKIKEIIQKTREIIGEEKIKALFAEYVPQTNVLTALKISDDPNKSIYNVQKHPDAECRNTLLASMAGQLFVFGVGNAVYLLLSTESGEELIRKWHNACNSKPPLEQAATSQMATAADSLITSDTVTNTSESSDEANKAKTATELVKKALVNADDREAIERTKKWVTFGSQIIAAAAACKVLPALVKMMPVGAATA